MAYIVGVLQVELHIPLCNSLKEKRGILRALENHVRKKFNVSVSEIGAQNAWRSAELGVAAGSTDRDRLDQTLHAVMGMLDRELNVQVIHFEVEIL
jgi:uncharacterized protein YlxP (DUF503 family)